ncbi:MAG: H(+)-transporting V1 sector ATPase subunit A [Watsoniomyces obsoletus]|nr:MAG: H(+)-transporting V1 sector ATPase subunit A [Watsoniomyces obsoletus]
MKEGDHISGGDVWGKVVENSLLNEHRVLMPPRARGTIKKIAKKGEYTVAEPLMTVEFNAGPSVYLAPSPSVFKRTLPSLSASVSSTSAGASSRTGASTSDVRRTIEAVQGTIGTMVSNTDSLSALIAGLDEGAGRVAVMSRGQARSIDRLNARIGEVRERSHALAAASERIGTSVQQNLASVDHFREASRTLDRTLALLAGDAQRFTQTLLAG